MDSVEPNYKAYESKRFYFPYRMVVLFVGVIYIFIMLGRTGRIKTNEVGVITSDKESTNGQAKVFAAAYIDFFTIRPKLYFFLSFTISIVLWSLLGIFILKLIYGN